jgi:hypothetical protein
VCVYLLRRKSTCTINAFSCDFDYALVFLLAFDLQRYFEADAV